MKSIAPTGEPTAIGPYRVLSIVVRRGLFREYLVQPAQVAEGSTYSLRTLVYAGASDAETLERYRREAEILSRVRHPNLLEVIDWGFWGQASAYFVSHRLAGSTLEDSVRWPWATVRPLVSQLLAGLVRLHEEGFIHRNLTPASLHVTPDGHLRIVDFSLVSMAKGQSWTATGTALGDMQYVPPEQIFDAKRADARSDLYNVGVLAYRMLSGHLPRENWSTKDFQTHLLTDPGQPLGPLVPGENPAVIEYVERLLQPDRERRPATARHALDALP